MDMAILVSYRPRLRPAPLFTSSRSLTSFLSISRLSSMQPLLNIAIRAARRAGEVIIRGMNRLHRLDVRAKGQNDFVTEIDTQAELEIIEIIRKHYPDHAVRRGRRAGPAEGEFLWIIDPLDGTTNFVHGFPQFAVHRRATSRPHGARRRVRPAASGALYHLARRRRPA